MVGLFTICVRLAAMMKPDQGGWKKRNRWSRRSIGLRTNFSMQTILGISFDFHDAAAALLRDGQLVAAAQEERFTRQKHDERFPINAINDCLREAELTIDKVEAVVYYEKPILKFDRLLETYIRTWPLGFRSFLKAMPVWMKSKLWVKQTIQKKLGYRGSIYFNEHHLSHAASAFYPSGFEEAVVVTIDGVGEWETTTIGYGQGTSLAITESIHFPDSLGLLYSALTYYLGFKVNSAEYKVMGLAPYGDPEPFDAAMRKLIRLNPDGSYRLDQRYFAYSYGLTMTNKRFDDLFGEPPREPESPLTQREKDIAASLQRVTEEAVLGIIKHAHDLHPSENLCLAGGVALNCVANEKILKHSPFKRIFIQPAAGDAGGALGAALYLSNAVFHHPRGVEMTHPYWGPAFRDCDIKEVLESHKIVCRKYDPNTLIKTAARFIANNHVIGWYQGRMEFGPRALGNRSILADPRQQKNWQRVNLKIKFRESFRPFAPSVLEEKSSEYFDNACPSPFMLLTAQARTKNLPAVTHVDNSARLQTVNKDQNPMYHDLIKAFGDLTGCPVVINTSFNVRGEPIVCSPKDALLCFLNTDMDDLFLGSYHVSKADNLHLVREEDRTRYLQTFVLD